MSSSKVMVSFSTDFLSHVQMLYQLALKQRLSGKVVVHGINSYTDYAAPAYISSVASIEAFLNEITFGPMTRILFKSSLLRRFDQEWLAFLDIKAKLMLIPQLLFDSTFDRSAQPYQDFDILVSVRNDFVHYRMHRSAPKYVKTLEDRSIALRATNHEEIDYPWVHKLSSSEGIRWAHNTSCRVVQALAQMIPDEHRDSIAGLAKSFVEIDAVQAKKLSQLHKSQGHN